MNTTTRIVIIDSDCDDANCLAELLLANSSANSIVIETNGQDAIDHFEIETASKPLLPSLIFTDLNMPRLGGFAVLEWLRSHPGFDSVPAIVLTDSRDPLDIDRAYALGANFYMVKPGNLARLEQMIHSLCAFWGLCIVPEITPLPEQSATALRKALHRDWSESLWFAEWLMLARNSRQKAL